MKVEKVSSLSTCAWCKKTKKFLQDKGIEYEFVDVDLCGDKDMDAIREDLKKRGLGMNFPVVIVDDKNCIVGFREDKLNEAFKD